MAKEKKAKEPFFTTMEFDNAQYAMDVKQKMEAKLERIKIGLIIAAVIEVIWILLYKVNMPGGLANVLLIVALGGTVAAYIFGGGLKTAFKATWKVAATLGWIGWFCVPFPADIFTGLLLTLFAMMLIPIMFLFIPLVLVFCNFIQVRKDYKAAEEYLQYCKPVSESVSEEEDGNQE